MIIYKCKKCKSDFHIKHKIDWNFLCPNCNKPYSLAYSDLTDISKNRVKFLDINEMIVKVLPNK